MHLFQTEWLREAPRSVATSYARRAYGTRHARPVPEAPVDPGVAVLVGPGWMVLEAMRTPDPPHFGRAA